MMKRSNGIVPPATITILVVVLVVLVTSTSANKSRRHPPIALPNCRDRCGNISIPYPFGIGPGCSLNHWYNVTCNFTSGLPFLPALNLNYTPFDPHTYPVPIKRINTTPISLATPLPSLVVQGPRVWLDDQGGRSTWSFTDYTHLDMRGSPFLLMPLLNTLVVIGCGGSGIIGNINNQAVIGCTTVCPDNAASHTIKDGVLQNSTKPLSQILGTSSSMGCYGMGCCQTSLPYSLDYFHLGFQTTYFTNSMTSAVVISLVSTSYFTNLANSSSTMNAIDFFEGTTTILQWRLQELPHNFPNRTSVQCANDTQQGGYHCHCINDFYEGNPYLPQGCQVIEACEQCPDSCSFLNGAYGCPAIYYQYHNKSAVPIALGVVQRRATQKFWNSPFLTKSP